MTERRRARLVRSAPVRQAVLLVTVVALVNLASLGVAWLTLRANTLDELNADLARDMASLDISASPGALRTLVAARARVTDPTDTVFVFIGNDGRITGNARAVVEGRDVGFTAMSAERRLSDEGYLDDVRRLSGGVLIVAKSLEPVARLGDTFFVLLVISTLPTVLIALGIGALIARASARRVERIEAVLERIAGGDLAARSGETGEGDDLSRIGARVNRMAEKQQAATETLRQVTTDIAHDLRTPLQRIGVTLQDLEARLPEGETRDLAGAAAEEADRAVSVFRALLQIAQIEGGTSRERLRPVDLAAIATRIAELYEPSAEDRGDSFVVEVPDAPVDVTGDPDLIGQALANLIENALRHTPPGGDIRVAVTPDGALIVADSGPGIPEGERDKVLRRLYRLERSRTTAGNGLGLALVAAIADSHRATLDLGDADPGLTVTLRFPR
ncbi:HAMP domain-containing sensor histidine kinase [Maritimibacter sp. UBA3975]|uniref:sensor histidine kinase n=1 Tax=Maritimibacter sp. UBA3975 TaxID=1946833 RepID=UPI000C0AF802|nr:HAMP domain-containing sensor histidine kinase [Maritimibacter sp. UBA3975]MAM59903.1 two-component sensor histidine kinase [Maritimibacter sp.]|tara:strand:- start:37 stop:1374 length:1338 start_codon:yes stop_codon:yes gene_type:complete